MKSFVCVLALFGLVGATSTKDKTITKVVKVLEDMMEKSKVDGDKDRNLYAKFKCFCDTQTAKKTGEVEDLAGDIARLQSKIEETKGSTGDLSSECAQLRADMMANEESRATAQEQRDKENSDFIAAETDMVNAIGQMKSAITTLSEVGADQTMEGAAEAHKVAMAGFGGTFLQKKSDKVRQALMVAQMLLMGTSAPRWHPFSKRHSLAPTARPLARWWVSSRTCATPSRKTLPRPGRRRRLSLRPIPSS